jgi:quercetin dioxygenase-like cupin family protein
MTSLLPLSLVAVETPKLGSTVFTWESREAKPTPVGERREVARQPSATLQEFECHISTLNPSMASHPPHTHPQEELIILRDGELDVHINGVNTRVGPGSMFFFAANDPHAVQNRGKNPATYFVFNFSSAATAGMKGQAPLPAAPGRMGSTIFQWTDLKVETTKTGERRAVVDLPTSTLANFECHVTTIKAGLAPHAPHHHPDEEILLVKEGQLDVTINGVTQRAGPGSIVFVSSGDEHGWNNAGDTAATYYVMRLKTESTPTTAVAMQ